MKTIIKTDIGIGFDSRSQEMKLWAACVSLLMTQQADAYSIFIPAPSEARTLEIIDLLFLRCYELDLCSFSQEIEPEKGEFEGRNLITIELPWKRKQ